LFTYGTKHGTKIVHEKGTNQRLCSQIPV